MVTYKRPDDLARSLAVLAVAPGVTGRRVVVDNEPGATNRAGVEAHGWEYLAMPDNTGPAGGLAAGVGMVLEGAEAQDWILFLDDDDPLPEPDVLVHLSAAGNQLLDEEVPIGGVGAVGARFDRSTGELVRLRDDELVGMVCVDAIGGGQLPLYQVAALRAAGGPRTDLFFAYDDVELGLRLTAAGYQLFVPADVWRAGRRRHPRPASAPARGRYRVAPWRTYYSVRNQIVIAREYSRRAAVARLVAKEGLVRPLCNAGRRGAWAQSIATWRGLADGLRGRLGRRVEPSSEKAAG